MNRRIGSTSFEYWARIESGPSLMNRQSVSNFLFLSQKYLTPVSSMRVSCIAMYVRGHFLVKAKHVCYEDFLTAVWACAYIGIKRQCSISTAMGTFKWRDRPILRGVPFLIDDPLEGFVRLTFEDCIVFEGNKDRVADGVVKRLALAHDVPERKHSRVIHCALFEDIS